MKRSMFRLLTISLSITALSLFASDVFSQGKGKGGCAKKLGEGGR